MNDKLKKETIIKQIQQASQIGILITRDVTNLGAVHLRASEDKRFVDLEELLNIIDDNLDNEIV